MGPGGPVGLDFGVLPVLFDLWDIEDKAMKRDIVADLVIIEGAALNQMAENQSQ